MNIKTKFLEARTGEQLAALLERQLSMLDERVVDVHVDLVMYQAIVVYRNEVSRSEQSGD